MKTLQTITQLAIPVCLVGIMILIHQSKGPVPVKWQYAEFQWQKPEFDKEYHPNQIKDTVVHFHWPINKDVDAPDLHLLLKAIGSRGWELVCFDGNNYICKRPVGNWPDDEFTISREWQNMPKNLLEAK